VSVAGKRGNASRDGSGDSRLCTTRRGSEVCIDLAKGDVNVRITLEAEYSLNGFTLLDDSYILREGNEYYLVEEQTGTKKKLEPKELLELVADDIEEEIREGLIP